MAADVALIGSSGIWRQDDHDLDTFTQFWGTHAADIHVGFALYGHDVRCCCY